MKRRLALAMAAGLPLLRPWQDASAALSPGQAVAWPDVTLLDGSRWGPAQAAGKAVVVVFWTTTCPYCRRHNQHVEQLQRAAAGRPLAILGVARESQPEAVRRHAREQGYSFPITLDHAPLAKALGARNSVPITATVDRQGRLKLLIPGEMFAADVMELLQLAAGH